MTRLSDLSEEVWKIILRLFHFEHKELELSFLISKKFYSTFSGLLSNLRIAHRMNVVPIRRGFSDAFLRFMNVKRITFLDTMKILVAFFKSYHDRHSVSSLLTLAKFVNFQWDPWKIRKENKDIICKSIIVLEYWEVINIGNLFARLEELDRSYLNLTNLLNDILHVSDYGIIELNKKISHFTSINLLVIKMTF